MSWANSQGVEVVAPATPSSVSIMRTVAASVAARTDMAIEVVDDLRIVVAEACSWLLTTDKQANRLRMNVTLEGMAVDVRVSIEPASDQVASRSRESLAWMVMEGLTDRAEETVSDTRRTIALRVSSTTPNSARDGE